MSTVRLCGDVELGEMVVECECGRFRGATRPHGYDKNATGLDCTDCIYGEKYLDDGVPHRIITTMCERCTEEGELPDHRVRDDARMKRFEQAWADYKMAWAKSIHPIATANDIDPEAKRRSLRAFRAGWRAAMRAVQIAEWGVDHRGRPMRHPPGGACYCKIPGDGWDRCGERSEKRNDTGP